MFDQFTKARLKITLLISVITAVILSAFGGTVYYFYKQQIVFEISDKLKSTAFEIARNLEEIPNDMFLLQKLKIPDDVYACIYNYSSGLLFYKGKICNFDTPFIGFKVFNQEVVFSVVINKNLDQYHIYVGKDLKNILKDMYKLKAILFYSFFGLSSVLLIFSFYISKYILRPLKLSMKKQEEFIQNTSHDLKTPLTVISSNIQLMKHKNFQNIEKNIEITESNLGYMKKIVEDMLFLSSIGQKTKEKVDINKIISEIIQYFEEKIKEKKLNIEINLNGNLHIYANYEDIKRLFFNLIENAIKYNDENGKIIIQSKNKTIYIKNTGKLIREEEKDKIFDRFYRADKSRSSEGTGLGLAIVNEIAKLYGIKIKVKIENNMNVFILKF